MFLQMLWVRNVIYLSLKIINNIFGSVEIYILQIIILGLIFLAAVPKRNPRITGQKSRYSVGEVVDLNCTSNASLPEAELSWYVNSVEVRILEDVLRGCDKVN